MARYSSPAVRRYQMRLAGFMAAYFGAIVGVGMLFRAHPPTSWIAVAIAILPALPILGVFWAVMRLTVEEPDEYLRHQFVRQCMIATAFCLAVTTVWQSLINYDVLPPGNGGFGPAFFWFLGLGLGAIWNAWADRRARQDVS